MQTLNEYIKEYRGLKKIDIKNLLNGVKDARGISENINFDFDHIGFDRDIGRTSFETTSENKDFHFELSKFLIRLLRHIDVDDKDALTLAYSLFVRSSKDGYRLKDLIEILEAKKVA